MEVEWLGDAVRSAKCLLPAQQVRDWEPDHGPVLEGSRHPWLPPSAGLFAQVYRGKATPRTSPRPPAGGGGAVSVQPAPSSWGSPAGRACGGGVKRRQLLELVQVALSAAWAEGGIGAGEPDEQVAPVLRCGGFGHLCLGLSEESAAAGEGGVAVAVGQQAVVADADEGARAGCGAGSAG